MTRRNSPTIECPLKLFDVMDLAVGVNLNGGRGKSNV